MALVTVQRSPSPSRTAEDSEQDTDVSVDSEAGLNQRSLKKIINSVRFINRLRFSESYFTIKGAALILPRSQKSLLRKKSKASLSSSAGGGIQGHLQSMFHLLRPQDTIQVAVKLESVTSSEKYLAIGVTQGVNDTEEGIILGFNCFPDSSAALALVVPIWQTVTMSLNGDGGFRVTSEDRTHNFKPVSVQTMWSAWNALNRMGDIARQHHYVPTGLTHSWLSFYTAKLTTNQSIINEWNIMDDLMVSRGDTLIPPDTGSERCRIETQIRQHLRGVMVGADLEELTSYMLRIELEQKMGIPLKAFRSFIDQEMLLIVRQLDLSSEIFNFLYLGSEWNASNMQELSDNGIGYILNVTREIDNFFPGEFKYMNIRVYDDEDAELMKYWEKTHRFICKARDNNSKVLIHCKMGVSRSASTVIAFAMKEYNWSLEEANKYVSSRRSVVRPNDSFVRQLETYEGILNASNQRLNPVWHQPTTMNASREDLVSESCPSDVGDDDDQNDEQVCRSTKANKSQTYAISGAEAGETCTDISTDSECSHNTDQSDLSSEEEQSDEDNEVEMINYRHIPTDREYIIDARTLNVEGFLQLQSSTTGTLGESAQLKLCRPASKITTVETIPNSPPPIQSHSAVARMLLKKRGEGTQSCPSTPNNRRRMAKSMPDLNSRRGSHGNSPGEERKQNRKSFGDGRIILKPKQAQSLPRDIQDKIAQYRKEEIPWTPGTVRRHREHLESPMLVGDNSAFLPSSETLSPAVTPGTVKKVAEEIEERNRVSPLAEPSEPLIRSASFKLERRHKLGDGIQRSSSVKETRVRNKPLISRGSSVSSPNDVEVANQELEYWRAFSRVQQKRVTSPPEKVHFLIGDGPEEEDIVQPSEKVSYPSLSGGDNTRRKEQQQPSPPVILTDNLDDLSSMNNNSPCKVDSGITVKDLVGVFEDVGCVDCSKSDPLTVRIASFNSDPFTKTMQPPPNPVSPLQRTQSLRGMPESSTSERPQPPRSGSFSRPKFTFDIRNITSPAQTILQPYWKIKQQNAYVSNS